MSPPAPTTVPDAGFAALVARIEPRLVAYLRAACGNRADAEDLFQEVCIALHGEGTGADKPDHWAFRVAHNKVVNFMKRRSLERRGLKRVAERTPAATGPDPSAERDERADRVQAALRDLPSDEREAVALKIWGQATWVEIGRALSISDDAAARAFARGLRTIAPILKNLAGESR